MFNKTQLLGLSLLACMGTCGCVERNLTINTEPAGALVFLNGEELGQAPVTVEFQWYGDYRVLCRKSGYEPLTTHRDLHAPWYSYFPIDFFANILYPGRIEEHYNWSFALEPQHPVDRETLIENALSLQKLLEDPNAVAMDPDLGPSPEQPPSQ